MTLRPHTRGISRWTITLSLVGGAPACDQTFPASGVTLGPADAGSGTYGPTGVVVPIFVSIAGAPAGLTINFAGEPSTITLAPTTVIANNNGNATSFAFVPYGTQGTVIASAVDAVPVEIPLAAPPITLCPGTPVEAGVLGAVGQVFTVGATAYVSGACDAAVPAAPAVGVPLSFTTIQSSGAGSAAGSPSANTSSSDASTSASSTSTIITNLEGGATADLAVPWGANVLVQVSGGGALAWTAIQGIGNPLSVQGMCWQPLPQVGSANVFQVQASVIGPGDAGVPGVPVTFSSVYPTASAAIVAPTTAQVTNGMGTATIVLGVPEGGALPVVAASAGTSVESIAVGVSSNECSSPPAGGTNSTLDAGAPSDANLDSADSP